MAYMNVVIIGYIIDIGIHAPSMRLLRQLPQNAAEVLSLVELGEQLGKVDQLHVLRLF